MILRGRYDGEFDRTNLPDDVILTNYFTVRDGQGHGPQLHACHQLLPGLGRAQGEGSTARGRLPSMRKRVLGTLSWEEVQRMEDAAGAYWRDIPRAQMVMLRGSPTSQRERPDEFDRLVLDFLGSRPLERPPPQMY